MCCIRSVGGLVGLVVVFGLAQDLALGSIGGGHVVELQCGGFATRVAPGSNTFDCFVQWRLARRHPPRASLTLTEQDLMGAVL